jgi:hypothetical protein
MGREGNGGKGRETGGRGIGYGVFFFEGEREGTGNRGKGKGTGGKETGYGGF